MRCLSCHLVTHGHVTHCSVELWRKGSRWKSLCTRSEKKWEWEQEHISPHHHTSCQPPSHWPHPLSDRPCYTIVTTFSKTCSSLLPHPLLLPHPRFCHTTHFCHAPHFCHVPHSLFLGCCCAELVIAHVTHTGAWKRFEGGGSVEWSSPHTLQSHTFDSGTGRERGGGREGRVG